MRFRSRRLLSLTIVAALAPGVLGLVRTANRIIVPASDTIAEDLYAFGGTVSIEGTVTGDVFAVTGILSVSGTVTGDVVGFAGTRVEVSGSVGGSVRVVSPTVRISGAVGDDVAALAAGTTLDAVVGRDVLLVSGTADVAGTTGRDVRAQVWRLGIGGEVAGDVRVKADRISLGAGTRVVGDVLYQARADATVDQAAAVDGDVVRTRVYSPVWARAVSRAISVLGALGFVLAGLVLGWLFPRTRRRAVEAAGERPWVTVGVGVAVLVLAPLAVVPLSLTLVGLPLALLLLLLWLLALFLGALPVVTRAGVWILRGRGGTAGALLVGAAAWWASMWLLPLAAVLLYVAATVVGLGAMARSMWALRSGAGAAAAV